MNGQGGLRGRQRQLGASDRLDEFHLQRTQLPDVLMRKADCLDHALFGSLLSASLDHGNAGGGSRHHDFQAGFLALLKGRIHHQAAIDIGNANRTHRSVERHVGHGDRRGRRNHRHDVGRVHLIGRNHRRHDLYVPLECLAEQWPQRAVYEP